MIARAQNRHVRISSAVVQSPIVRVGSVQVLVRVAWGGSVVAVASSSFHGSSTSAAVIAIGCSGHGSHAGSPSSI